MNRSTASGASKSQAGSGARRSGASSTTRSNRAGNQSGSRSNTSSSNRGSNRSGTSSGKRPNTRSRGSQSRRQSNHRGTRERKPITFKRVLTWLMLTMLTLFVLGCATLGILYARTSIPKPEAIALAEKTTVYYADGTTPIGSFAEQNRNIIDCTALPDYVGNAIVASENRSFYTDQGIDFKGIARALINNITKGTRQGGSTITQQYAERYYLGETKSYLGKLKEALLALKIAQTQSKHDVLCNYMNTIYLGRGAYGIQAAAQAYFGINADQLSVSQAAMLAGIIPAPSSWDPAVNPDRATQRWTRVLNIMREDGYINDQQKQEALAGSLPQTINHVQQETYAGPKGYLLQMVRDELTGSGAFTDSDLDTNGYHIVTTIDQHKQDLMFNVASPAHGGQGIVPEGVQIGGLSVNAKDGSIIALYAGDDYLTKQLNNATQALYQPGSTMKPFALLGAVQSGVNLHTVFNGNSPQRFEGITDPVRNYGNQSFGYVDLYQATAQSVNTVYMSIQQKLGGAAKVAQIAQEAGMSKQYMTGKNPFTVLGNDGVRMKDVAQAFATIANQGQRPTLHVVASVTNAKGDQLYNAPTNPTRVFTDHDTALVAQAMRATVQYGTASEARAVRHDIAGKTGTANDGTAGSFVGFTPDVVTVFGMWYPDEKGNPRELPNIGWYGNGSSYPVHLFTQYMTQALQGTPNTPLPTVNDTGKYGGPDGSWGTGYRPQEHAQNQQEQTEDDSEQTQQDQQNAQQPTEQTEQSPQPAQPEQTQPANPGNPATPAAPPTSGNTPSAPTTPTAPENPGNPGNQPGNPNPNTSGNPVNPAAPSATAPSAASAAGRRHAHTR